MTVNKHKEKNLKNMNDSWDFDQSFDANQKICKTQQINDDSSSDDEKIIQPSQAIHPESDQEIEKPSTQSPIFRSALSQ